MDINEIKDIKTKELVQKYNFRFSKSLGQNFLIDDSVPRDIVNGADVCEDDLVIEIGPGVGTLTVQLLKRAKRVVAIELDSSLIPILTAELGDNPKFQLIHNDALKVDFNEIIGDEKSVKLVANLPYYVTTPIIVNLLKGGYNFKSLTIMIQKEVAERMNAEPNCKDYGALSILVQYYCNTKIVRKVPPSCFIPRPKVDSIVIRLERLEEPSVKVKNEKLFFEIVRHAFNMRRKTLWNATKNVKLPKELMEKAYEEGRGFRPDGMVAELHKLWRLARVILALKQVAHAFFPRRIGQNFVAAVVVAAAAHRFASVEFHHVVFNADGVHVRRVPLTVVGLHLGSGFFSLLRFLFENRIQRAIKQERINGLPGPVPVRQLPVPDVFILKDAVCRLLFRLCHLMTVRMGKKRAAYQQRSQSQRNFCKLCSHSKILIPFYKNEDVIL